MAQQIRGRRAALHGAEVMVVVRGARVTCADEELRQGRANRVSVEKLRIGERRVLIAADAASGFVKRLAVTR